ncbi:MAG: biotin--[acetyl-CoA-carboxylase] ligase [Gemmatimonadaceae bacterium]
MAEIARFDGCTEAELAGAIGVNQVVLFDTVQSTLDEAHRLAAAGATAGTIVLAEEQTAGRGRNGRSWTSERGKGLWLTIVERPVDSQSLDGLAIRLGLAAALALERFTQDRIKLKWPNDLYSGGSKLGGILVETRWRGDSIDWVAIGFGLNTRLPAGLAGAAAVDSSHSRLEILSELVPAIRSAAAKTGSLTPGELAAWAARDLARGRRCIEPANGTVRGIDSGGRLLVASAFGEMAFGTGSLVLENM